jgi:hypothetical protein
MQKLIVVLLCMVVVLVACGGNDDSDGDDGREPQARTPGTVDDGPTPTITPRPDGALPLGGVTSIPETTEPSLTPMETSGLPGIELVGGFAETCDITESYSELLGFDVIYYDLTTVNYVETTLRDGENEVLSFNTAPGENRDGEGGWGIYPEAYSVPDNTTIRVDIEVYLDETGDITSESTLYYNCTTGEMIQKDYRLFDD